MILNASGRAPVILAGHAPQTASLLSASLSPVLATSLTADPTLLVTGALASLYLPVEIHYRGAATRATLTAPLQRRDSALTMA